MNYITWLQEWFQKHCDGAWEHMYGIEIGTLDNPGWYIKIDLNDTNMLDKQTFEYKEELDDNDWIQCMVKENIFYGYGDPQKLERLIQIFKDWVQ